MRTPTGSSCASNNYTTRCHRRLELVSSSSFSVAVGDKMPAEWEPAPDRGLGPSATHGWAALPRWGRSASMVARTLGQYVAVCLRFQLTSYTQLTSTLSRIKCERYIFIKKCVCSFIEIRIICWLYFRNIVVSWLYNTLSQLKNDTGTYLVTGRIVNKLKYVFQTNPNLLDRKTKKKPKRITKKKKAKWK